MAAVFRRRDFYTTGRLVRLGSCALWVALWFMTTAALSASASAQVPPWSELEPGIDKADLVALGHVKQAQYVSGIGTRITVQVEEILAPSNRAGKPKKSMQLSYFLDSGRKVPQKEKQLLFLQKPAKKGFHHRLQAAVTDRDKNQAHKIEWVRQVIMRKLIDRNKQGKRFVLFYFQQLAHVEEWPRLQALKELERLQRVRESELRALTKVEDFKFALGSFPESPAKKRLTELWNWRKQEPKKE